MADVRHKKRLERYETWATECQMLARSVTDHSKQEQYEYLAAHYSYLAASQSVGNAQRRISQIDVALTDIRRCGRQLVLLNVA